MLSLLSTEDLIPADHPIRRIREVVEVVLDDLDGAFDGMYAATGRRSVPPEMLLKATVLMAMYSIRSERAFCELIRPGFRGGSRPLSEDEGYEYKCEVQADDAAVFAGAEGAGGADGVGAAGRAGYDSGHGEAGC